MKNSGVYIVKNIITGDFYIGSSVNLSRRLNDHRNKLSKNKHHNILLQRSYNKYGVHSFSFSIVCHCDINLILYLEQQYILSMKPTYNIAESTSAPMLGKRHSEESRNKMELRQVFRGKDHPCYGVKWSEEYKQKWIKSRIGIKRSESFKRKISEANIRNNSGKYFQKYHEEHRKSVIDNEGNKFPSLYTCAKFHGVKISTVCDVLKGRSKSLKKKYKLWYYSDYLQLINDNELPKITIIEHELIPYDE